MPTRQCNLGATSTFAHPSHHVPAAHDSGRIDSAAMRLRANALTPIGTVHLELLHRCR